MKVRLTKFLQSYKQLLEILKESIGGKFSHDDDLDQLLEKFFVLKNKTEANLIEENKKL